MKRLATLLFVSSFAWSARAQDAARSSTAVAPNVALDCGLGVAQLNLAHSDFGSVTGSAIGLRHPSGILFNGTLHVFPFSLRNIGFVSSVEATSITADEVVPGNISSDDSPSMLSVVAGPEAQARVDMFVFRAGALAGFRTTSFGDYTSTEPRIAFRAQTDVTFGGWRKHDGMGFAFGTFAGVDVVPTLGWSWGISLTFAMF